jgi:hypothetical protein
MTAKLSTLRIPQKKRALVLPGGGGRGAYQVGVAKAFEEVGIKFDMIFGTSIGALNGVMMAQGSIERLEQLWSALRPWDVFKLPSAQQIGRMVFGRKLGLLDTAPLEELLRREVDLKKLKNNPTKVGLFTTDLCCLETRLITIEDIMSNNELIDVRLHFRRDNCTETGSGSTADWSAIRRCGRLWIMARKRFSWSCCIRSKWMSVRPTCGNCWRDAWTSCSMLPRGKSWKCCSCTTA